MIVFTSSKIGEFEKLSFKVENKSHNPFDEEIQDIAKELSKNYMVRCLVKIST